MGTGVLYAEKAKWQTCTFKDCKRGRCIYKHGTGDEQISDHGHDPNKLGLKSNQTVVQNNITTANGAQNQAPPQGRWMTDEDIEKVVEQDVQTIMETLHHRGEGVRDRLIRYFQQRHTPSGATSLTTKSFQGIVRATGYHSGRAATTSLLRSFQVKVGQALDSGGTDHILGHRDQDGAYDWVQLPQPLPVDTANGSVRATWRCTVDTILGPMTCYYLDNGGPQFTLLSVDQLCREGDFTYVHTRQGAYIKFPGTTITEQLIADEGLQFIRPFDGTDGTTMEAANKHTNSYYNSYSTNSTATRPEGDSTPETLQSPILSFKNITSIHSKERKTNKLIKEYGYGRDKAKSTAAATKKTVTIAKQTVTIPTASQGHAPPILRGHYQWAPGTHEGPQGRKVTTANKFSALSTEDETDKEADDEDQQVDETRVHAEVVFGGHPGTTGQAQPTPGWSEARHLTLVPDGTIPVMGVVTPGAELQDPVSFPEMTTEHLQPRGFQQSEAYLQHIQSGHATKNPHCMECVLGGQQAAKTPFGKATDTRMPADDGFAAACDFWGPTDPDVSGNRWHMLIVELKSKWATYQGLPTKHSEGALKGLLHFWGQLKRLTKSDKPIKSLHSDSGKEFMGAIDKHCLAHGITRTTTGGYNAKKNIIVENRNKTAGERLRKCLATATGGNNYWAELTGPCMAHVILYG